MGYDVHITRGDWWDKGAATISDDEWRQHVEADTELTMAGQVSATAPSGETLTYRNPLLANWLGHPSGSPIPFDFRGGCVVVKNPDDSVIQKMRAIAASLGARVQGDEGEFYD